MRTFVLASLAAVSIAVVHCGGIVEGNPDGGFPCPVTSPGTMQCASEGQQCSFETKVCDYPTTETCTCKSGEWACPIMNGDCPAQVCPTDVTEGTSCFVKDQQCYSNVISTCSDVSPLCTCDGTQFHCPVPDCPVNYCPPPEMVAQGAPCNAPANATCMTTVIDCDGGTTNGGSCICSGNHWMCAVPVCEGIDAGPPDAGGSD